MCTKEETAITRTKVQARGTQGVKIGGSPSAPGGLVAIINHPGEALTETFYISFSVLQVNGALAYLSLSVATGAHSTCVSALAVGVGDFIPIPLPRWSLCWGKCFSLWSVVATC